MCEDYIDETEHKQDLVSIKKNLSENVKVDDIITYS